MRIQIGAFTLETDYGLYITAPRFELFAGDRQRLPTHKFADCWRDEGTLYVQFGPWEITTSVLPAAAPHDAGGDAAAEAA